MFVQSKLGEIAIEDARFEIGTIDLFGPLATEVLFAVLKVGKGTCTNNDHVNTSFKSQLLAFGSNFPFPK